MDKQLFSITDIDDDLIQYADKYLKKVIIHAKHHYYRKQKQKEKYGIVLLDLDTFSEELGYEEKGYETTLCQYIDVKGIRIPILDQDLAEAILSLTELQRLVLLQNVCLNITLKDIAHDLKISERMARKHKHNAIESLGRRIEKDAEV